MVSKRTYLNELHREWYAANAKLSVAQTALSNAEIDVGQYQGVVDELQREIDEVKAWLTGPE